MRSQDEEPVGSRRVRGGVRRSSSVAGLPGETAAFADSSTEGGQPLVSVVIPAFNNAPTIGETLQTVREQTYRPLEIIVVDDGSTDTTAEIVSAHMLRDPRIRLIRQGNSGVAAARNRGVAESAGDFIAFLDADDLWRPAKIARQMEALGRCGEDTAVVYAWSCLIDEDDRILASGGHQVLEGDVFAAMCRRDFIGHGSAALVRKSAFLAVGGCDSSLCAGGVRAGDDTRLHLALAERYRFALAPEELVGYRLRRGSGADHHLEVAALHRMAVAPFRARHPQYAPLMDLQLKELLLWLCGRALRSGNYRSAAALVSEIASLDPLFAVYAVIFAPIRPLVMRARRFRSGAAKRWSDGASDDASGAA